MRPTIFVDRDGTLIVEGPEPLAGPAGVHLLPGAVEALKRFRAAGYRIVVVSNQSAVAMGRITEEDVRLVHSHLGHLLADLGAAVDGFYHCPHHPQGKVPAYTRVCACRKPEPGLLLQAAKNLEIDLAASWAVGDMARDLAAGRAAGTRTCLVRTGKGAAEQAHADFDLVAEDLREAAELILEYRK